MQLASAWPPWPPPPPLPPDLQPSRGVAQCNYELLRAFGGWMDERRLRYTLGAGSLLGAARSTPPGLLQWEHDVDVYVPARDASLLLRGLRADCSTSTVWRSHFCSTLLPLGLVDRKGEPCCGFGFKLYHRRRRACELDVLVLGATTAPYQHGETAWWPPACTWWSGPVHAAWSAFLARPSSRRARRYFVIPEDVVDKLSMASDGHARWCDRRTGQRASSTRALGGRSSSRAWADEWVWCGAPLSYFQDEYFEEAELFPARRIRMYDLSVPVPREPWALLNRTYGRACAHVAHLNEHGGVEADLRLRQFARLRRPARVRTATTSTGDSSPLRRDNIIRR